MAVTKPRAVIFGVAGLTLTSAERDFFSRTQPLGFILFSRNIDHPAQVQKLVDDLRRTVDHPEAPVLIDQEGGRIARLEPPHWRRTLPPVVFGQLAESDPKLASRVTRDNAWLIGKELTQLGISVNCAPCMDTTVSQTHPIIGDRSFSNNVDIISTLSLQAIYGYLEAGIMPVIKHLPGHGRAAVDSHEVPAPVYTNREELTKTDFRAFRLAVDSLHSAFPGFSPWGMTAHVTYMDIDPANPATHSTAVIDGVIRGNIGFSGFLMSDCITMKALSGSLAKRAKHTIEAGCDAVLHCSGQLEEMIEVAAQIGPLRMEALARYEASCRIPLIRRQDDVIEVQRALETTWRQVGLNDNSKNF